MKQSAVLDIRQAGQPKAYVEPEEISVAADPVVQYMSEPQLLKAIEKAKTAMQKAARQMDYMEAARLRDEWVALQEEFKNKFGKEPEA